MLACWWVEFHLGLVAVIPNGSSSAIKPNENVEEKDIHFTITEETSGEVESSGVEQVGSPPEFFSEMQKSEGNVPSSSTSKGRVPLITCKLNSVVFRKGVDALSILLSNRGICHYEYLPLLFCYLLLPWLNILHAFFWF